MLTELRVKNYALIKDLVFTPGQTFNVITGETGAGKSILLGAMGLILGERTDTVAVKENEEKCIIESCFNIEGYDLKSWFIQNEFDYDTELVIRREISVSGKSRAFINDTPAQLFQLKEIGRYLIDIHSQHDNLDLFQKSFQFKVLDSFAGIQKEQLNYKQKYEYLKVVNRKLAELHESEKRGIEERDYKQFLYEELQSANLVEGETANLEEELLVLSNADSNLQTLSDITNHLLESEVALIDQLAVLRNQLLQVSKNDKRFDEISEKFNESYFNLKDIGSEIKKLADETHADPERLEIVNQRFTFLHNLSKKHREEDLIAKRDSLSDELRKFATLDAEIHNLESEREIVLNECKVLAEFLSRKRFEFSTSLESQINEMIIDLGMPGAKIKVDLNSHPEKDLGIYGIDDTNVLYSPASGKAFNPIQNIASGGEISRVMLVLKAILAKKNIMPTIIFDEIDTGVSGEVAFKMGEMLDAMSKNMQLIVVTHLPQIASKGKRHFFVYKKQINNSTSSDMRELENEERVNEIAEMMGGKMFGESILESARQLLTPL